MPVATGMVRVYRPEPRPAGTMAAAGWDVSAAGCEVATAGCEVTTAGWAVTTYVAAPPVMMPSELVWVRSAVIGFE